MKILVTGGAGYVGSTLVPMLLNAGHKVRALDNLMYGGEGLIPCFRNPNFEFIEGDVCDRSALTHAIWGCDLVIHLAAIVGFPACRRDPNLAHSVNYLGTRNVAYVAGRSLPIIFTSTGSNYGAVDGICTEETPLKPLSLYGRTKVAAEECLLEECETIIYRFSTGFGLSPRMRLDLLVNDFVYQVITEHYLVVYEAHFMRTFIHVIDMARAILFAIANLDNMMGEVYNVGSDTMNHSKQQVCELIKQQIDYYLHFVDVGHDADKRDYVVSFDKVTKLGYSTTVSLEEGIEELRRSLMLFDVRNPYSNV